MSNRASVKYSGSAKMKNARVRWTPIAGSGVKKN
jgi:hypothetical protein